MAASQFPRSSPVLISNQFQNTSKSAIEAGINLGLEEFPRLPASSSTSLGINGDPKSSNISSGLKDGCWSGSHNISSSSVPSISTKLPNFEEPISVDGQPAAVFSSGELKSEIDICESLVVGYFVGKRPYFPFVKESLNALWKTKGDFSMTIHGDNVFLFKFLLDEDRTRILELGSVHIGSKLFLIRPWSPFIESHIDAISTVPVWMNLKGVPIHLWNAVGLARIASLVGKPIMTDIPTAMKTRMSFARVRVEITADCSFPAELPVKVDDVKFVVKAEYPWKPVSCTHCKSFGHLSNECSSNPSHKTKSVWVPKLKVSSLDASAKSGNKGSLEPNSRVQEVDAGSHTNNETTNKVTNEITVVEDVEVVFVDSRDKPFENILKMDVDKNAPFVKEAASTSSTDLSIPPGFECSNRFHGLEVEEEAVSSKEREAASSTSSFPSIPPGFEGSNKFHGLEEEEEVATSKLEVEELKITHKPSSSESISVSNRKVSKKSKATGLFPNGTLSTKNSIDSSKISTNKLVDYGSLYGLSFPSSIKKCREMCSDVVKNHKHLSLEEMDESHS